MSLLMRGLHAEMLCAAGVLDLLHILRPNLSMSGISWDFLYTWKT